MEKSNSLNRIDSDDKIHIINPYNHRNKLPTAEDINKILKSEGINHEVSDLKWWIISLTHKSYVKKDNKDNKDSKVILVDKPDNCLELLPRSNVVSVSLTRDALTVHGSVPWLEIIVLRSRLLVWSIKTWHERLWVIA